MKCYPLAIAAHIAIALDCIRRGDLDGAQAALAHARALAREGAAATAHVAGARSSRCADRRLHRCGIARAGNNERPM